MEESEIISYRYSNIVASTAELCAIGLAKLKYTRQSILCLSELWSGLVGLG
jgi:hypothetical protein